ncbi:MAG: M48 family metalloprotease, partial [Planctomycetota bacterium]
MIARPLVAFLVASALSCARQGAGGAEPDRAPRAPERGSIEEEMRRARERFLAEEGAGGLSAEAFSDADEASVGEATARAVFARFRAFPADSRASLYVRKVGALLAARSSRPGVPYRFAVLVADEVNAFAAPYGYVFVTAGALRFAKDEAELAFLLAHEIAHVERRHGLAQICRARLDLEKRAARGRADALAEPLEAEAKARLEELQKRMDELSDLVVRGYGREDEREADLIALDLVSRTGYDPQAALRLLERIAEAGGKEELPIPKLFRSHPRPEERLAAARRALAG